jgi:DNA polymerase III subunit epsilon
VIRYVALDTETTGLDYKQGHRLIEVGAVELIERQLTGRTFHHYINPERAIDEGAKRVHGIDEAFLADKPVFASVAEELWQFCEGAELVIHNASFDMGFLDHELSLLQRPALSSVCQIRDTLKEARLLYPGKRNNLNALSERLGINVSHRTFHGALLDAQILADVFLAMTRGQQSLIEEEKGIQRKIDPLSPSKHAVRTKIIYASEDENISHAEYLAGFKQAQWG